MKNIILFWVIATLCTSLKAQEVDPSLISTTGYYNLSGEVKLHFAIGEPAISTYSNGIVLTEGFYQNSIGLISSEESILLDISTEIFPNPCTEILNIKFDSADQIAINIYDLNGRKVVPQTVSNRGKAIYVRDLLSGQYFLQLSNNQGKYNILKFIKS